MRSTMKARVALLGTSCYHFLMLCFSHIEGDCRSSSSALGWNEMHSVLQEMERGTGSQDLLRCNLVPDRNFCGVGQVIWPLFSHFSKETKVYHFTGIL